MDDYSAYQGAFEIFRKVNCIGARENCIFGAIVDRTRSASFAASAVGKATFGPAGFMVGNAIGRERDLRGSRIYDYAHALFNFTENGVRIMPLVGSVLTINPKKSKPAYEGFVFYSYQEISNISINKYYGIRNSIKTITITLADNHKLHFLQKWLRKHCLIKNTI